MCMSVFSLRSASISHGLPSLSLRLPPSARSPCSQVDIQLSPGSHASEAAVNKQLSDKERVAAALENPNLLHMVDKCLAGGVALS